MTLDQSALSPALKQQLKARKRIADRNKELSNQYREVKQTYPKVWKDIIGFLQRRYDDNAQAISKRMGATLDPENPNKIKIIPLTNEQVVTLLDKNAEVDVLLNYLQAKVKPATI